MNERLMLFLWPILAAFTALGCEKQPQVAPDAQQEKLTIIATAYPLADIARQVGGAEVEVEWLCEAGQPAELREPSEDVRARIRVANLVISGGESWAVEGFDDPFRAQQIIRIDTLPAAKEPGAPGNGLIWLDPVAGLELAEQLCERLSAARASRAPYFRSQADPIIRDVRKIVEDWSGRIESGAARRVIVFSDDFNRLLWRFKVRAVRPVDGEPTRLSDRQLREIREAARKEDVKTIIVSTDTSAAAMRDLSERTGLKVVALDPLGSSSASGRNTYLKLLRFNLEQLAGAVAGR
jgi:zinc transport system substrate-binding protein